MTKRRVKDDTDQPGLFDWQAERDQAMEQVAANAEDHAPGFAARAREFVLQYLAEHGPTSGEVLTNACKQAGIVAHDDRAFGPCYARLVREGRIRKAGHCIRKKGRGTGGGVIWALADGERAE